MPRRPSNESEPSALPPLSLASSRAGAALESVNARGTVASVLIERPASTRASLGLVLPSFPTTMNLTQTIQAGYAAVVFGTLTIPVDVTLTVDGFLALTNVVYTS